VYDAVKKVLPPSSGAKQSKKIFMHYDLSKRRESLTQAQRHIQEHPNHQQRCYGILECRLFICETQFVEMPEMRRKCPTKLLDKSDGRTYLPFRLSKFCSGFVSPETQPIDYPTMQLSTICIYIIHTIIHPSACPTQPPTCQSTAGISAGRYGVEISHPVNSRSDVSAV
jgi:hypothetical protein